MVEEADMTEHLAPLVPAEIDLRGLEYMPLLGARLFSSDFDASATDSEWRAAVTLWWAAWWQRPAGSLPQDDVILCKLANLGRDMKAWRKVKSRALHGFVECSDGRIYHPVICEQALVAWDKRVKERARKAKWRQQKSGQDAGQDVAVPRDKTGTGPGQDAAVPADGTGRDGTGRDNVVGRGESTPPGIARARAAPRPDDVPKPVWDDWLTLRRAKRAPVTGTVVAGARAEAAKAGMTLADFLGVWCARGSQGLQAEWLHPDERRPKPVNGHATEPEWRREQRERMEAFAGPYAAKRSGARPIATVIDMEAPNAIARRVD